MIIATAQGASARLGPPLTTVEFGTIDDRYTRRCSWLCGCEGELIGAELIELRCCPRHNQNHTYRQESA